MPPTPRIAIIGAGIGGLTAALDLARQGCAVTLLERAATVGGKMRQVTLPGAPPIDAGPTVFTMRWVFDQLLADANTSLDSELTLHPLALLARHAWNATERLDLFADLEASADAIAAFAGPREAAGYRAFAARAQRIYDTLKAPFLQSPQPGSPLALVRRAGVADMLGIAAFSTLWRALAEYFHDPRLHQLFGRYATYNGSSPFAAPATLMLIAHVERSGVWRIGGGMHALAAMLARLAEARGATIRTGAHVAAIETDRGRATAITLATGERIDADAILMAADTAALPAGCLGAPVRPAIPPTRPAERSLSALTWCLRARVAYPLAHHTVVFGRAYAHEFEDIFRRDRLPQVTPTTYICAQDRTEADPSTGPERLFVLVNAPARGDTAPPSPEEIAACAQRTAHHLATCGLDLNLEQAPSMTGPKEFATLFPGTGGALYGAAVHGSTASFRRPGSRTRIPNLYCAGGTTHPGAGVPMAALSGRLAAQAILEDLTSRVPSRRTATRGGTSTR